MSEFTDNEPELKETKERARFFQVVHAWPLTEELNYIGWLKNFTTEADRRIASLILDFFTYYPVEMVKQMLRVSVGQAGQSLVNHFDDWKHSDFKYRCIYSSIPGETPNPSDSGNYFTRILRDLGVAENQIVEYKEIPDVLVKLSKPTPVIFVDDFVGSGNQIVKAWNVNKCNNGKSLREMSEQDKHVFVYAPLIVNHMGYDRIKRDCPTLILSTPHILGPEYNLFNPKCFCWRNDEDLFNAGVELILRKSKELGIPSTYGISSQDEKGFGAQGLALKFAHGAPDAIPSFFYWCHDNWIPLFTKNYQRDEQ